MIIHSVMLISCVHLNKIYCINPNTLAIFIVDVSLFLIIRMVIACDITFSYVAQLQKKIYQNEAILYIIIKRFTRRHSPLRLDCTVQ